MIVDLTGKVILITGPSRGIGRALAVACGRAGATVVLCGRPSEALDAAYDEIAGGPGPEPFLAPLDLETADEADYERLSQAVQEKFLRLDGLVLNAGLLGPRTPLAYVSAADWDRVMNVNLRSPFLMTRALLPALAEAPWAQVVLVSSGVGRKPRAHWGPYAVSKAAVEALAQILHQEHTRTSQIRFNTVDPGGTRTAMRATAYPAEDPGTLPTPEDVLPVFLHLLSDRGGAHDGDRLEARDWLETRL